MIIIIAMTITIIMIMLLLPSSSSALRHNTLKSTSIICIHVQAHIHPLYYSFFP